MYDFAAAFLWTVLSDFIFLNIGKGFRVRCAKGNNHETHVLAVLCQHLCTGDTQIEWKKESKKHILEWKFLMNHCSLNKM